MRRKKNILLIIITVFFYNINVFAQAEDTLAANKIIIHEDVRMDILAKKESDINTAILKAQSRMGKGYRLMVLNSGDRGYAMKVRAELLQNYPEQKIYMGFANPYIKIKFGNFKTSEDAEPYRKAISKLLNGASIYILSETIEVKPDKDFNPDDMQQ